jgi:hypothetical protein
MLQPICLLFMLELPGVSDKPLLLSAIGNTDLVRSILIPDSSTSSVTMLFVLLQLSPLSGSGLVVNTNKTSTQDHYGLVCFAQWPMVWQYSSCANTRNQP